MKQTNIFDFLVESMSDTILTSSDLMIEITGISEDTNIDIIA